MKIHFSSYLTALSALLLVLTGVWFVDKTQQERFQQQNRADVLHQLSTVRARLEGALDSRLFLLRGLVAFISNYTDVDQVEFEDLAKIIIAYQTGIDSIYLAKNTVVTNIYPPQKKAALGQKLMEESVQRQGIQQAIEHKKTTITGPVKTATGRVIFVGNTPIFLTPRGKEPESGDYWGLAGIGIDRTTLMKEAGMLNPLVKIDYGLRVHDSLSNSERMLFGQEKIFYEDPVLLDVSLPNGWWQLAAIPLDGWPSNYPHQWWVQNGGVLLALLTGIIVFRLVNAPFYLREAIAQATSTLNANEAKYRELVENANSIILRIDHQGNITFFNEFAQGFFGYSEQEIIGKNIIGTIMAQVDGAGKDLGVMLINCLQNPAQYTSYENENIRRNGERVWISWTNKALLDHQGIFRGILCIGTDISDRKWAEQELQRANEELETRVEERTTELKQKAFQLETALHQLQLTQTQLVHSEKMSSLGQLIAGIAHEINNPVNFIHGNLSYIIDYTQDFLKLINVYQQEYSQTNPRIEAVLEEIEWDFIREDLGKIVSSMQIGTERIRQIVLSLRNFSRLDESDMKPVDIHEGIESTLLILQNRLKPHHSVTDIQIIKEYGDLPLVECYAGQLNQVFMNILSNALDALQTKRFNYLQVNLAAIEQQMIPAKPDEGRTEEAINQERGNSDYPQFDLPTIRIRTKVMDSDRIRIEIADNGMGMTEEIKNNIFNPFFTTKDVGKGTGLGLSISYQIVVEKHLGELQCRSAPELGTLFIIELPRKCVRTLAVQK